jgi:hypothetical protein
MSWLLVPLLVVGGLLLLLAAVVVRRRLLHRGVGTIDCSLRLSRRRLERGWVLGVGRCTERDLEWYRVVSLWPRPGRRYRRRLLEVVSQRAPTGDEVYALPAGSTVLECATGAPDGGTVELGLPPEALTAFLAWTESAPPDWTGPARRRRR